nr:sulfate ABC transporter substrate-binding protein [uncultured Clostridium sp.]
MRKRGKKRAAALALLVAAAVMSAGCAKQTDSGKDGTITITNVSYDPTREFYQEYNKIFESHYRDTFKTGITVVQSHGGSGGQARSVIEGAKADVVTLALAHDITMIEKSGLIDSGWMKEFEGNSSPYTSAIVFLVRKGNEKKIKDWSDLIKPGVEIITPDPKSSGGACWNFLAAWQYSKVTYHGDEEKMKSFAADIYKNVSVMDSGARGATTTFVENGQGDVLIAWENEAINTVKEYPDQYEIITPSISILAEPSVAVVDENARRDGAEKASEEYLKYLYSDEAQRLIGEYGYRPSNKKILSEFSEKFDLNVKLCTIDDFGGWDAAYETYFADGGIFDEIYEN